MKKPPRLAYFLLKTFVPSGISEFFLGDIEEQFQWIATDTDDRKANRWFWKQTISSLVPLLNLAIRKNLHLSAFRVITTFAVVLPVIATSPLKDSGAYYSLSELVALLFAAFALGFLCRLIIHNVRFITAITIALIIFTISLIVRGDWLELPWLLVLVTIFISSGAGLALVMPNRNSPNPKIRA